MAVFGPSGQGHTLLDPDVGDRSPAPIRRRMTLGRMMKAIAFIAILLGIVVRAQDLPEILAFAFVFVVLAACVYGVSRLPYRVRLAIELVTAGSLLVLTGWVWRPPFYSRQAERCDEVADVCAILAANTNDERMAAQFWGEVTEYRLKGHMYKTRAVWAALIRFFTGQTTERISDPEMIRAFELHRALDRHYHLARKRNLVYRWW